MKHLFKIIHLILIACQLSAMDQQLLIDQTDHAKKLYTQAKELIDSKQNLNTPLPATGSPLLVASSRNDEHIATTLLLLSQGANPQVYDNLGNTPLLYAAHHCAVRTIIVLLYFNADPNHCSYQESKNKRTPLHALCDPNQDSFDLNKNESRIHSVEWLLAAGANTNAQDSRGNTPLFGLVVCHHEKRSSVLLSPRKKMIFHQSRKNLINAVLACKACPDVKNSLGRTLHDQTGCEVDPYLSIYVGFKIKERREKLRQVLLTFLKGSPLKPERESPFKNIPADILRYILKYAYP